MFGLQRRRLMKRQQITTALAARTPADLWAALLAHARTLQPFWAGAVAVFAGRTSLPEEKRDGYPLKPRRGGILRVLIIVRISTDHQDARSLDDQDAFCRQYVESRYKGPIEFVVIHDRGSGEFLDLVKNS